MNFRTDTARRRFGWFAWALLAFNFPVILWGAYVRVSYSGDGCGAHWPFCNGQVLPAQMTKPTIIEFTHRMMTSADTIGMVVLCIWAFMAFPKRHAVRRYSLASLVFLLIEAALGAGLVIFRLVAKDQSAGRVWYLSAHLTNTMLLLGAMAITAWLASNSISRLRLRDSPPLFFWAALVTVVVSLTGVIAALGDTLFPSASLAEGMQRDFASGSPLLLRLRLTHPAMALLGAAFIIWAGLTLIRSHPGTVAGKAAMRVIGLAVFQIVWGALNLTLLAPLWMQLSHLLLADTLWVAVVVMILEAGQAGPLEVPVAELSRQSALREAAQR
jgi:heme A synthase